MDCRGFPGRGADGAGDALDRDGESIEETDSCVTPLKKR